MDDTGSIKSTVPDVKTYNGPQWNFIAPACPGGFVAKERLPAPIDGRSIEYHGETFAIPFWEIKEGSRPERVLNLIPFGEFPVDYVQFHGRQSAASIYYLRVYLEKMPRIIDPITLFYFAWDMDRVARMVKAPFESGGTGWDKTTEKRIESVPVHQLKPHDPFYVNEPNAQLILVL